MMLPASPSSSAAATPPTHREVGRRLFTYLRPHLTRLIIGLVCGTLVGLAQAKVAFLLKAFMDGIAKPGGAGAAIITQVCVTLIVLYSALWVLRYSQSILLGVIAQRVGLAMRRDVYAHLQTMSLSYFHKRRTGALMSILSNDVGKLQSAAMLMKDVVATPIQACVLLGTMFVLSWKLTLFALLVIPAIAGTIQLLTKKLRKLSKETQETQGNVSAVMEETLSSPRIVRAFNAEDREVARFEAASEDMLRVQLKSLRRNARLGPTVDLIGVIGVALTLFVGGREVTAQHMTPGSLVSFILVVSNLANSANAIGGLRSSWEEMMGAADRIFADVLDVQSEIQDAPNAEVITKVRGKIEYRDVSFSYLPNQPTLQYINLTIEPGQVVALVGETGAGKSTLADLVPRFYDPTNGGVFLDGRDLRTVTQESLRAQISIVPQETLLFAGSIRDNIAYGKPDATDAEVEAAARAANAESFITSYPARYQTRIGERGTTLSGGERQRIAIARALLADPKILILDEATSALDASTEALVQEALDTLMQNRTTLVIAHRLSTIVNADKIVVLRRGGIIAEEGTHSELMARGGAYAALYETQKRQASNTEVTVSAAPGSMALVPPVLSVSTNS